MSSLLLLAALASCGGGDSQPVALSPATVGQSVVDFGEIPPDATLQQIMSLSADGGVSLNVSDVGTNDLGASYGIARFDSDTYLVSDYTNSQLRFINATTGADEQSAIQLTFRPSGVLVLPDDQANDIVVLDYFGGRALRLRSAGGYSEPNTAWIYSIGRTTNDVGIGFTNPRLRSLARDGDTLAILTLNDFGFDGSGFNLPSRGSFVTINLTSGAQNFAPRVVGNFYPGEVATRAAGEYIATNYGNLNESNSGLARIRPGATPGQQLQRLDMMQQFGDLNIQRTAGLALRSTGDFTTIFFTNYGTPNASSTGLDPGQLWRFAIQGAGNTLSFPTTPARPILIEDDSTTQGSDRNPMALAKQDSEFVCGLANFFNPGQQEAPFQISDECGAYIVSGTNYRELTNVASGGGTTTPFRPVPPASVLEGETEIDNQVTIFREGNYALTQPFTTTGDTAGSTITYPVGTVVTSFFLNWDPTATGGGDATASITGDITFSGPVLQGDNGILGSAPETCATGFFALFLNPCEARTQLNDSDLRFGNSGTSYPTGADTAGNTRRETGDGSPPNEFVRIRTGTNNRTVEFTLNTFGDFVDQARILVIP